jgi:hypothetical protein
MGDGAAVLGWTSMLRRFRGFGDCLVKDDDELTTRLPNGECMRLGMTEMR